VLAAATFSAVRSANRAARTAERTLLAGLRPLLLQSRLEAPEQKVMWRGRHFAHLPGGRAVVEVGKDDEDDDVIYLAASVRNVGAGMAVLHGWQVSTGAPDTNQERPRPEEFRRLSIDLYVAPNDLGYWLSAIRDADDPDRQMVLDALAARELIRVAVLYGDHEGGQRTVTQFIFTPITEGFLCVAARHWNIDRDDPR
jgi:hypothetical protein